MNILSIGNSFSEDAQRYLSKIANADGVKITSVNLMLGGCSLSRHYKNMLTGDAEYFLEYNGDNTGFKISLKEALINRDWDFITLQQVSHESVNYDTYQPYLGELSKYVRKMAPKAKQVIHQTWEYEADSKLLRENLGYNTPDDMFNDIKRAYTCAAKDINAELIIPSGELFHGLVKEGLKIHRDTFHATYGLGRYALGLLWYHILTGNEISENIFNNFDEPVSRDEIVVVKKCINNNLRL